MSDGDWFAPKRLGYGTGLPIAWQGWALLGGYLAGMLGCMKLKRDGHLIVSAALLVILTAAFAITAARHTRGGWRWRTGGE